MCICFQHKLSWCLQKTLKKEILMDHITLLLLSLSLSHWNTVPKISVPSLFLPHSISLFLLSIYMSLSLPVLKLDIYKGWQNYPEIQVEAGKAALCYKGLAKNKCSKVRWTYRYCISIYIYIGCSYVHTFQIGELFKSICAWHCKCNLALYN